jgi:hypothetical protein
MTQDEINQLEALLNKAWEIYPQADAIYVNGGNLWGRSFEINTGAMIDFNEKNPEGTTPFLVY